MYNMNKRMVWYANLFSLLSRFILTLHNTWIAFYGIDESDSQEMCTKKAERYVRMKL